MARVSDLLAAGRTYSFEFFPPKTDGAQLSLGHTIAELEPLAPSFVSVTYGAGGTHRSRTREIVSWVRQETSITPMAHLTCQGHTRAEVAEILDDYRDRRHREHPRARRRSARRPRRPPAERLPVRVRPARRHRRRPTSRSASPPIPRSIPAHADRETDRRLLAAKLAAGRLRHHPVLLRGRALRPPRRGARRARCRQAGAAGHHADHERQPDRPDGRAQRGGHPDAGWSIDSTACDGPRRGAPASASTSPARCAPNCSSWARRGCTSTRSTAARRAGRSTPTSVSAACRESGV